MKILLLLFLSGCSLTKSYKDDNIIEEIAEEVIEYYCDVELDLTPNTPE